MSEGHSAAAPNKGGPRQTGPTSGAIARARSRSALPKWRTFLTGCTGHSATPEERLPASSVAATSSASYQQRHHRALRPEPAGRSTGHTAAPACPASPSSRRRRALRQRVAVGMGPAPSGAAACRPSDNPPSFGHRPRQPACRRLPGRTCPSAGVRTCPACTRRPAASHPTGRRRSRLASSRRMARRACRWLRSGGTGAPARWSDSRGRRTCRGPDSGCRRVPTRWQRRGASPARPAAPRAAG
mmetsp:Transcript_8502/g.27979  ORF Transcript_8502/g.27979 Transcript_8502/m.27979 type:complete len:243 (+) Transcript_8502:1031-1759(+)